MALEVEMTPRWESHRCPKLTVPVMTSNEISHLPFMKFNAAAFFRRLRAILEPEEYSTQGCQPHVKTLHQRNILRNEPQKFP
jgi:hypothetical protein